MIPFGKWKLRKIVIGGNMERLNRMILYVLERAASIVKKLSRTGKYEQIVGIIDFHGFSFLEHGCFKCESIQNFLLPSPIASARTKNLLTVFTIVIGIPLISTFITTYEANYPEYIKNWYIINGEWVVVLFLNIRQCTSTNIGQKYLQASFNYEIKRK